MGFSLFNNNFTRVYRTLLLNYHLVVRHDGIVRVLVERRGYMHFYVSMFFIINYLNLNLKIITLT